MQVSLVEKNKETLSSIEDAISSVFINLDYIKSASYLSICDYLGIKEIRKEEGQLFFTTQPLNIDIFLQTLSEARLKNLVRAIIAGDDNFKYLPEDWREKFINELSSNRDLIIWIKKKINDLKEEPLALKPILNGYFFEDVDSENIVKKNNIFELLSGKNDEEIADIKNFVTKLIIGRLEEKETLKDFGISNGIDAKLAAANLNLEIADVEALTTYDAEKRNQAIGEIVAEFINRLEEIEGKCNFMGIDHKKMLQDLLTNESNPSFEEIKKNVATANFRSAIQAIKFFEEALKKIEILSSYVSSNS